MTKYKNRQERTISPSKKKKKRTNNNGVLVKKKKITVLKIKIKELRDIILKLGGS